MIPTASRAFARSAAAAASRRTMATEPKMHKATDHWKDLASKRPVQHDDLHMVFHPPFNKPTVLLVILGAVFTGYGAMQFGFNHQQYKQGYWK